MAAALLLVAGAGIAFASGALENGRAPRTAAPSLAPLPVAMLAVPEVALTRESTVDVSGQVPTGVSGDALELRLYVNGEVAARQSLPDADEFTFSGVALEQGENELSVTLADDEREGPPSAVVVVTRDDVPPDIRISRPATDRPVYRAAELLIGRTEAGADLVVEIESSGRTQPAFVSADGRFEAPLSLAMGANSYTLRSVDEAGNEAEERIVVTRAASLASLELDVSRRNFTTDQLPTTVKVTARIRDELGVLAEGADVTFSVSPPNSRTMTWRVSSERGVAAWPQLSINGEQRAIGTWLVTVRAVLASGEEVRGDASIEVTAPEE